MSTKEVSKNHNVIIRCDALYSLIKIRSFTKKQMFRVIYTDAEGFSTLTNGLHMKFCSVRTDDVTESEIVYMRHNFFTAHNFFYRSRCVLKREDDSCNWIIKNEIVLSRIEVAHLDELVKLFLGFCSGPEDFTLTTLRRMASKKSNVKIKNVVLQNYLQVNNVKNFEMSPTNVTYLY